MDFCLLPHTTSATAGKTVAYRYGSMKIYGRMAFRQVLALIASMQIIAFLSVPKIGRRMVKSG
jgi:hypothetical protein